MSANHEREGLSDEIQKKIKHLIEASYPEISKEGLEWFIKQISQIVAPQYLGLSAHERREGLNKAKQNYQNILRLSRELREEIEAYLDSDIVGPPPVSDSDATMESWCDEVYPIKSKMNHFFNWLVWVEEKLKEWPERCGQSTSPLKFVDLRLKIFALAMQFDALIPEARLTVFKEGKGSLFQKIVSSLWPEAGWRVIQSGVELYKRSKSKKPDLLPVNPYTQKPI